MELDIELDKIDLIGLVEREHLNINVSEDKLQIPEGVKIKYGNRFIYKSYNNTLLHSVCKSEKFNIEVLDILLRIGGVVYMDSVNNLHQSPERSIELNIFLDDNQKRIAKAEFRKIRENRIKEVVLERMRLENEQKRIIKHMRRYSEILSNIQQNMVITQQNIQQNMVIAQQNVVAVEQNRQQIAQQNAVAAEQNRQRMLQQIVQQQGQQMIGDNKEGVIDSIIVSNDENNANRKRDIPLVDNGRKRRRKYADGFVK